MKPQDIGSVFCLSEERLNEIKSVKVKSDDLRYYSLCREALCAVALSIDKKKRKALLPAYSCQTVLDPFEQNGYEIVLYSAKPDMSIDTLDIVQKAKEFKPTITVVHPYHGMDFNDDEIKALKEVRKTGSEIVEDLTQCLFSEREYDFVDYYVGSIRKWADTVEGGFLRTNKKIDSPTECNKDFFEVRKTAMEIKQKYFETGDKELKKECSELLEKSDEISERIIVPHKMTELAVKLFKTVDQQNAKQKRIENYTYLYNEISKMDGKKIRPIIGDLTRLTTAPLFFPVYVKERDELWDELKRNDVHALKLWKGHKKQVEIDDNVKTLFLNTMTIPCDQRYTEKDLKRVVKIINDFIK